MKKMLTMFLATVTLTLAGCGGGGGGGYTHAELADDFVYRLQFALGWDVELVKTYTEQWDHIVVYDYDYGTYDAYYIGGYLPIDDIGDYVSFYNSDFFYDLDYIGSNLYEDPFTGIIFREEMSFQRNTLKQAGVQQNTVAQKLASHLVQSYNVPQVSAEKVAKAGIMLQIMNKQGAGESAYSDMMKNLTGTELSQWKDAYSTGNTAKQEQLKAITARSLNMSASDLNNVIEKLMN